MKVYVVTDGDYSDYRIEAVFTDKKKAQQYAALHNFDNVEEYEADNVKIDGEPKVYVNYEFVARHGCFYLDRKFYSTNKIKEVVESRWKELHCYVSLSLDIDDEEKARKIAQDMYARYNAEQSGI